MVAASNSFDGGSQGTTITTGNSGGASGTAFNVVTIGGSSTEVFDSHGKGLFSGKIAPQSGQFDYVAWTTAIGTQSDVIYGRFYMYLTANPNAALHVVRTLSSSSARYAVVINTNGTVSLFGSSDTAFSTSTATVPLNQWCRVEFDCNYSTGGDGAGDAFLYFGNPDAPYPDYTEVIGGFSPTGTSADTFRFGKGQNNTFTDTFWIDEININTDGSPGPVVTSSPRTHGAQAGVFLPTSGPISYGAPATI